jgi:DNA primase
MNDVSIAHSVLDRAALPAPDVFFRRNVPHYRRTGGKARGTCPFHHQSPKRRGLFHSLPFSMNLSIGLWHCFVCGLGGDVIEFVKLRDGVDFMSAARTLAVLRPLGKLEAQIYWRDRDAKQARLRRKDDDFYQSVQLLLREMELYESVRDWAFRQHHAELQDLTQQLIDAVGADYILTKVDYEG